MDVKCSGKSFSFYTIQGPSNLRSHLALMFSSFFTGCFAITTVFSHAQTVVVCPSCTSVLCQPTGGKARLTEGTFPHPSPISFILISTSTHSRILIP